MNANASTPPPDELPAEIVRESWNEYRLEDGTIVRTRPIVLKVVFPEGRPVPGQATTVALGAMPVISVFPASDRRGPKATANPTADEIRRAPNTPLSYVAVQEAWCYYRIPGIPGGLKVRMNLATVTRAEGLFNTEGEQVYSIGWTVTGGPIPEDQLQTDLRALPPPG